MSVSSQSGTACALNPNLSPCRQVQVIHASIDCQCMTQSTRTGYQRSDIIRIPTQTHGSNPEFRLKRANQNGATKTHIFGNHVYAIFGVDRINVSMSGGSKHGRIRFPFAASRMGCRVSIGKIGLRFNNQTTGPFTMDPRDQTLSQQSTGNGDGIGLVKRTRKNGIRQRSICLSPE